MVVRYQPLLKSPFLTVQVVGNKGGDDTCDGVFDRSLMKFFEVLFASNLSAGYCITPLFKM